MLSAFWFECLIYIRAFLCFCFKAGAISIHSPNMSITRSVQEDVFFSVDVSCIGTPTIQWTFMSGTVSRTIGTWQPGVYTNISVDYSSRVQPHDNGSMGLLDLRLQDAGYYVVTVTEKTGSSKDAGLVLKVNGESVLPFLSVLMVQMRSAMFSAPGSTALRGKRFSRFPACAPHNQFL